MAAAVMRFAPLLASALLLAACGNRQPLHLSAARRAPPKPALAAVAPTPEQLLVAPPMARPVRQDDGLSRSQLRQDDPFDLPPTR
jgi:hypothetical protein